MELSTPPQASETPASAPEFPFASGLEGSAKSEKGRPSVIHEYCLDAIDKGHTRCIWICIKKGKRWVAKDIKIDKIGGMLGIPELRKQCSWWKRHSLYSAVGVKEVMFRFAKINKETKEVSVWVKDFDYDSRITEIQYAIDNLPDLEEPWECGVNVMGKGHAPVYACPNSAYDSFEGRVYCVAQEYRQFRLQREVLEWLPTMMEFYWQNGIQPDQVEFLENSNFVTCYKNLLWDKDRDATSPYGRIVHGFQLIEGWRIRYIMCLVTASLFLSACVVAVSTAIQQSFEAGLTAGSYTLAIAAVGLAALTLLSAIL